ncbi:hypothetical protein [Natrarchaeobius oligotrophus]|uniref:Uncharacterized protein n=1 Tax=Natrarchaeobius chitinivorans TaxID=1679083 RepID=A0A3N6MSZ3_NATCH|nr:hypothetical protein [Natrarchaeobius chitinivorans]RQH00961.1 hypothetical protein EA472_10100 [Natrarchaeobius chitinivorans]
MSERNPDAAYTELTPDAWHQDDEGNYTLDCPECGSAATLMNVVQHGRCNGYLDRREAETAVDEERMECTAKLWLELGYVSDPGDDSSEGAGGESIEDGSENVESDDVDPDEGVRGEGQPPGADGAVDDAQH